jgi:hypothetical protein
MALALIALVGMSAAVQGQSKGEAIPPEITKTVNAFRGYWVLNGVDTEPSFQTPVHFQLTISCKPAALGAAVSCDFVGRLPGVGRIEAASVIGYSPEEQVIRWMEISSTGEYHDHRGKWKGDGIDFEPLEFSISGNKATEDLSVAFPSPGKLILRSVTETAEGKSTLQCTGKRLSSKPR